MKELSELDKYVKTKVVTEAIRIVTGQGSDEFNGCYTCVRSADDEEFTIWNRVQHLFELILASSAKKKDGDQITLFLFQKLCKVPGFLSKIGSGGIMKADYDILFKTVTKKYEVQTMDIYCFFEAVETLSQKIFKDAETLEQALEKFLELAIAEYEKN